MGRSTAVARALPPAAWGLVTALALSSMLVGCGAPAPARRLVVALDGVPLTLDPHYHNDALTWSLLSNFYDGLVRFSAEMQLEPGLAASWEQIDARTWSFHLRDGARFASGLPVRAADVVASIDRGRDDPRSQLRHHLVGITRALARDDRTVVIETDDPRPTLLNRLAFLMVVPEALAARREITEVDGTGPYRVVTSATGVSIDAEAWPSWHAAPSVERVRFMFAWDARALADRFLAGEIDVLRTYPEDQLGELRAHPGLRAEPQPRLVVQMLSACPRAASGETARALASPAVRRALLLATDRARYVREAFHGNAIVASQYVQPVVTGYDPGVSPAPHDPDGARRLLADAGFAHGFAATLECTSGQLELVQPIVDDLARVGVRVATRLLPWSELMERARAQKAELMLFGWGCSTADASDFLNACAHAAARERGFGIENYAGYADRETDALIEAAERELDRARRLLLLQAAQSRVLAALPFLPLTVRFGHVGASARVELATRHDQWLWVAAFRWKEGVQ